jgi:hypothetical protein
MPITDEVETAVDILAPQVGVSLKVGKIIAWTILAIAAAIIGGWVIWKLFFAERAAQQKSQQVQAEAAIGKGDAGAKAGHDAIQITVDNGKAAAGIDAAVREAIHAISKAKGADQLLDPAVDAAGRRAICMRPSAASLPDCQHLQQPNP